MATSLRTLLTALLLCVPQIAAAQSLPDPTRPAIDLGGSGAAGRAAAKPVPRGLQSTIISPHYRAAIINGETVPLGGRYGNSRLVEVREDSVVLQNARGGRHVMELFPKVGIKKNEAAQPESGVQEKASGQSGLPEKDVGGIK